MHGRAFGFWRARVVPARQNCHRDLSGDLVSAATYWHTSMADLGPGPAMNPHAQDTGYMHMVRQALANGVPFLETLLHADWMDASRDGGGTRLTDRLIEVIFEDVRASEFADRPPRVGSVHLFRSIEAARLFNTRFRQGNGRIYRCLIQQGTPFASYMDWVNPGIYLGQPIAPQLEEMRQRARSYWQAVIPPNPEFSEALVQGSVIVVAQETVQP